MLLGDRANEMRSVPPKSSALELNATVTAAYASSLLDYLRRQGREPETLYPADQIRSLEGGDGRRLVPLSRWMQMLDVASEALGQPDLPLRVGRSMGAKHLGILGYVGMSCANMRDSLRQLVRYSHLVGNISRARLHVDGGQAELIWQWCHEALPPSSMAQVQMAARWSAGQRFTGRTDLRAEAHFQFAAPADTREYLDLFGGPCLFDRSETKLVFPAAYLELPFVTGDPAMRAMIARQARKVLDRQDREPDFLMRLRQTLQEGLALGRVSLKDAAGAIGMSTRSLQRRLSELGLSFQRVLDDARLVQAERLLKDRRNSLAEIAFLLGYTEQSSFQAAFKRWTGMTPQGWRESAGQ